MKLLFCGHCATLVVPDARPRQPRSCPCGRHLVWWEDPISGILRVHDRYRTLQIYTHEETSWEGPSASWRPACWIIGLHNGWLTHHAGGRAAIDQVLADTPDTYLFKTQGSIAIRIRPGESNDTAYANLPAAEPVRAPI